MPLRQVYPQPQRKRSGAMMRSSHWRSGKHGGDCALGHLGDGPNRRQAGRRDSGIGNIRTGRGRQPNPSGGGCVRPEPPRHPRPRQLRRAARGRGGAGGLRLHAASAARRVDHQGARSRQGGAVRKAAGREPPGSDGDGGNRRLPPALPDGSVHVPRPPADRQSTRIGARRRHRRSAADRRQPRLRIALRPEQPPAQQRTRRRRHHGRRLLSGVHGASCRWRRTHRNRRFRHAGGDRNGSLGFGAAEVPKRNHSPRLHRGVAFPRQHRAHLRFQGIDPRFHAVVRQSARRHLGVRPRSPRRARNHQRQRQAHLRVGSRCGRRSARGR